MTKTVPGRLNRVSPGTSPRHQEWLLYCGILISVCGNSSCLQVGSRDPECQEISHKKVREGCYFLRRKELSGMGGEKLITKYLQVPSDMT